MVALVRPVQLHDLVIPSDQPSHAPVQRRPPTPPPAQQRNAIPRQRSHSHLQRMRDLRAASQSTTPTLSPLSLRSPISKTKPQLLAAGGARAYAAYVKATKATNNSTVRFASQSGEPAGGPAASSSGVGAHGRATAAYGRVGASYTRIPAHQLCARPHKVQGSRHLQPSRRNGHPLFVAVTRQSGQVPAVCAWR
jgi:hypothetical protein